MGALPAKHSQDAIRIRFAQRLEAWGDRVALVAAGGREISYRELAHLSDGFAKRLPASVRLLAIETRNTLESVAAYLGALRRGVAVINYAPGGLAGDLLARFKPDAVYLRSPHTNDWVLTLQPQKRRVVPHPDLALLLSTSGSTGEPKLVRLSAANLQANAESIGDYLGLTPQDRAITTLPFSYSYGLSVLNSHLAVGASVVLTELSVSAPEFRDAVIRHRVSSLAGVPYTYDLLHRSGFLADLPTGLRTLTQAGGRMAPDMVRSVRDSVERTGARLFVMYGQTEATARIAYLTPELLETRPDCIGMAIPGGELWVEDSEGSPLAAGQEGELVYRGSNVMMGYATSPQDLTLAAGVDRLRTGDLGVEVQPGVFKITGRLSRFVKPYGLRIGLDELERRCSTRNATVRIAGDDQLIVVAAETDAALDAARSAIEQLKLPAGLVEFLLVSSLPLLSETKPNYPEILALGQDARSARLGLRTGRDDLEILLARLAGARKVQGDDTFQSLGGDSLSYVQFSIALEQTLGELPVRWETLTVRELRSLVRRRAKSQAPKRFATLESDVVVRCLAILLIVTQHAVGGMQGGADVLMLLSGFSWARFKRQPLLDRRQWDVFKDYSFRYLGIYMAILTVSAVLKGGHFSISHLLFFSTFVHDSENALNIYWFIESLTWISLLVCVAFSFKAVRSVVRERPVASALGLVAVALAARVVGQGVQDVQIQAFRTPDQMLIYFAIGWAMANTQRHVQVLLVTIGFAVSGLAWGWNDTHAPVMAAAGLTMAFFPRVLIPRMLMGPIVLIAAASFYIYIFNVFPMHFISWILRAPLGSYWPENIAASLTIGVCAYLAATWLQGGFQRWRGRQLERAQRAPAI